MRYTTRVDSMVHMYMHTGTLYTGLRVYMHVLYQQDILLSRGIVYFDLIWALFSSKACTICNIYIYIGIK